MRTFLVLLVLTNIAYFGWNQGWLRELPDAPPRQQQSRAVLPAADFVPAREGLTLLTELSAAERAALESIPAPEAPPPASPDGGAVEAQPPASADSSTVAAVAQPWCAVLGQFPDIAAAQALLPELQSLGVEARLREQNVPVATTYWVYMPAFADAAQTQRMVAELQERGIDRYYMRDGQFAGGISMGVFSRIASAETLQADLARRGYQTQIGEVQREEARVFLDLQAPAAAFTEQPAWAGFRARTAAVTLEEIVCESVASGF